MVERPGPRLSHLFHQNHVFSLSLSLRLHVPASRRLSETEKKPNDLVRLPELNLPRARGTPRRQRRLRRPGHAPHPADDGTRRGDERRERRPRDRVPDPQRAHVVEEEDPGGVEAISRRGAHVLSHGERGRPRCDLLPLLSLLVPLPLRGGAPALAVGALVERRVHKLRVGGGHDLDKVLDGAGPPARGRVGAGRGARCGGCGEGREREWCCFLFSSDFVF